jgi:hypothetical protein
MSINEKGEFAALMHAGAFFAVFFMDGATDQELIDYGHALGDALARVMRPAVEA